MSSNEPANAIIIYKIALLTELEKQGSIDERDFPKLLSELKQRLGKMGHQINDNDNIHILDVIEIRNGKITLNEDGLKYLKIIKTLLNDTPKT